MDMCMGALVHVWMDGWLLMCKQERTERKDGLSGGRTDRWMEERCSIRHDVACVNWYVSGSRWQWVWGIDPSSCGKQARTIRTMDQHNVFAKQATARSAANAGMPVNSSRI